MDDIRRLLNILEAAPSPVDKTDSELAQAYRNWFYGMRADNLKAFELGQKQESGQSALNPLYSTTNTSAGEKPPRGATW